METKNRFLKILMITLALFFVTGTAHAAYVDVTSSFEGTYSFTGDGAGGDFSYDVIFDLWEGTGVDAGLYSYRYTVTNYVDLGSFEDRYFETLILAYNANIYEVGSIAGTGVTPSGFSSSPLIQWDFTGQNFDEGQTSDVLYFITDGYPEGWFTSYGNVYLGDATGLLPGAAMPEPSTFLLLGIGVVGCFAGLRKRFKKQ
ncbi:PEP-CTERM sorting domain-containing protein [Thermodesulfobacteriota bacterium]